MELTSSAFTDGDPIPRQFARDGGNRSPPLAWREVPIRARSLALIVDDPDAPSGTFTHWLLYDLPSSTGELPEGLPPDAEPRLFGDQGVNDYGEPGYGGPQPPPGESHRYIFTLHALDIVPDLPPGVGKEEVQRALHGHVLAEATLTGTYSREQPAPVEGA